MNKAKIETIKNPDGTQGYSWNPITGCLNTCEYCYARKLANTRLRERYLANTNITDAWKDGAEGFAFKEAMSDPFYPRFREDKISAAVQGRRSRRKPRGIFTCDMSDLFGIGIPENWTARVLEIVRGNWQDRFYLLTKQPQNLIKFSPFPVNCYVGVSVTNSPMFVEALDRLDGICAEVKYLSFEPLLDWHIDPYILEKDLSAQQLDGVIIGSQTGNLNEIKQSAMLYPDLTLMPYGKKWTLQPKIEWVKELVEACDKAGVPVFLKNSLYDLFMNIPHNDLYWEDMSNLRQEMPSVR